jgi:uncharacterized protein (TIGR02271 family)
MTLPAGSGSERDRYINWDELIKKEARDRDGEDLGEVQKVGPSYVLTEKGLISKDRFYIPKSLVQGYDGETVWFYVTKEQAEREFIRETAPTSDEYSSYKITEADAAIGNRKADLDVETRIPVIEERLGVSKTESKTEAKITKEPVTETKTVEVPVTHEELTVERRPASETSTTDRPASSREEVTVPLKHEEVSVTKEPYVKEEVALKKKPVTETRQVTEDVTSEKVDVTE